MTPTPTPAQEAAAKAIIDRYAVYSSLYHAGISAVATLIAERDAARAELATYECCICGGSLADGVSIAVDGVERVAHPNCAREKDRTLAAPPSPAK